MNISPIPGIQTDKRIVMGYGPKTAKILIVGEAPGAQEERDGKPFVGNAGHVLTDMLHKAGIPRKACYITNVVKERPPKNNIKPFLNLRKKHPDMSQSYHAYEEFLKKEIMQVHPNVVIAAGGTALWALCRKKGIQLYRGSILESTLIPGLKVIPIIHPSATFHTWTHRTLIWFDLMRAKEQAEFPWFKFKDRQYILAPSYDDCINYLIECESKDLVAFDIETYGTEVSCISFSYSPDHAISIPFLTEGRSDYFTPPQEADIWRQIAEVLQSNTVHAVGHNTTFDSTFLFRKYGIRTTNIHDTMVASAILFPDFKRGLDFVTSLYTDIPYYKLEGKSAIKGRATPTRAFWEYNAKDSIVLMEALPQQLEELERMGNLETYNRQRSLIPVLTYMTELGIQMDAEGLKKKARAANKRIRDLTKELHALCGYEINPASSKQVMDYFYEVKGLKPYKNRKTGRPTANEGALKRLVRRGHREADILLEIRKVDKLRGTYFEMELDKDNRLRCSMNPGKTKTGRLASSKTIFGTGANMQNQPPIMKKYMLPDEGYVVYNMDLAQAENRVVAYLGPDTTQIDAFETGKDLHSLTASYISPAWGLKLTPEEIKEQDRLFQETREDQYASPIGQGKYSWRYWGKKANHAFNYGQGYRAFAYQVEIPEKEGEMIRDRYFSAYPGVSKMHGWVKEELKKGMSLTNLMGRTRQFNDRWGSSLFDEAFAFIPQSTIADVINLRGLLYIYNNQELFHDVQILNQIHDSIIIQIPIDAGWDYHAQCLLSIEASLTTPLSFKGREFSIPVDTQMHVVNFKEGVELRFPKMYYPSGDGRSIVHTTAQYLQENFESLCSIQ